MDIALAGLSLAFQLFAGCIQGFSMVTTACTMTKDARILLCLIGLEEQRLLGWARMSGLLDDRLDPRLNTQGILAALQELSILLNDRDKLRSYGLGEDSQNEAAEDPSAISIVGVADSLFDGAESRTTNDRFAVLLRAGKALKTMRRLRWVVSDKTQMEKYVHQIHNFVDALQSLLDQVQSEKLLEHLRMIKLQSIGMASTVDDTELLQQAESIIPGHNTQVSMLARLRTLQITQGHGSQEGRKTFAPLPPNAVLNLVENTSGSRATGLFNNHRVLVEWKRYNREQRHAFNVFDIEKRVTDFFLMLNAPKPSDFCTPRCVGYFEDSARQRFGFLYEEPAIENMQEVNLLSVLLTPSKPSLTIRLNLARALAKQVFQLLVVNWLHKGICAENILFSAKPTQPSTAAYPTVLLDKPHVLGYELSRPDNIHEFSEQPLLSTHQDIYRHPDVVSSYRGRPYSGHHDVYSLGLVLLEIAKWRPLKRIVRSIVDVDRIKRPGSISIDVASQIRAHIIARDNPDHDHLGDVEFRAGTAMMEAIRSCLTDFEDGSHVKSDMRSRFHELVVEKLDHCSI